MIWEGVPLQVREFFVELVFSIFIGKGTLTFFQLLTNKIYLQGAEEKKQLIAEIESWKNRCELQEKKLVSLLSLTIDRL